MQHNAVFSNPAEGAKAMSAVQHALAANAMPILEAMVVDMAMAHPRDPYEFVMLWLGGNSACADGTVTASEFLTDNTTDYMRRYGTDILQDCVKELATHHTEWIGKGEAAVRAVAARGLRTSATLAGVVTATSDASPTQEADTCLVEADQVEEPAVCNQAAMRGGTERLQVLPVQEDAAADVSFQAFGHERQGELAAATATEPAARIEAAVPVIKPAMQAENMVKVRGSQASAVDVAVARAGAVDVDESARRLQASARGWAARKRVAQLRAKEQTELAIAATSDAVIAQAAAEAADGAVAAAETDEQCAAAIAIQARVRGMASRKRVKAMKAESMAMRAHADVFEAEANVLEHAAAVEGPATQRSKEDAAIHIQKVMRGRAARKRSAMLRAEAEQQEKSSKAVEQADAEA